MHLYIHIYLPCCAHDAPRLSDHGPLEVELSVDALFTPGRIGSLTLKNRVIKSPQTSALANQDGSVTPRIVNHYKRLAEGGVGLIMVEYTYIDDIASKSIHCQLGISRHEHIAGHGWLVDTVHAAGAKIGLQLEHCGRQKFLGTEPMKSATDSSWDYAEAKFGVKPTPMTIDEIQQVVRDFGQAAQRAYLARYDLVEIHGGHGYLITNFLSPHTNWRTDEYGGSFENRNRLLLEVVDEVRRQVPRDFPLSVRLSVTDYEKDGIPIEETVELCALLEQHGVDVIHASGGYHAKQHYEAVSWFMPRALHRWGWEQIKERVSVPVIASGAIVRPELAGEIVASGSADFASLGRAMLADPDWTIKAQQGRLLEIAPCIRCNDGCLLRGLDSGRSVGCTVNPRVGNEYAFPMTKATQSKRVAVVGGGTAGMRAAIDLTDRGHHVTLFSAGPLGGGLRRAGEVLEDPNFLELSAHLQHEVERRAVEVKHVRAGTGELDGYELVFLASGLAPRPFTGQISSDAVRVVVADDLTHESTAALEGPVVIVGAGLMGVRLGMLLTGRGIDTVVLEQSDRILADDDVIYDQIFFPEIVAESGVEIRHGISVTQVTADGVSAVSNGIDVTVPAATVVLALGHEPDVPAWAESERTPDVVIGGARKRGRVFDAIHDAFYSSLHY
jgi:2,4-dienoyl-CoA reductase-like NADH-dependent reductase (Old Yellow Enzyme family)/ribulose 1,5-bisphosphate synthetase/thiazole synthase